MRQALKEAFGPAQEAATPIADTAVITVDGKRGWAGVYLPDGQAWSYQANGPYWMRRGDGPSLSMPDEEYGHTDYRIRRPDWRGRIVVIEAYPYDAPRSFWASQEERDSFIWAEARRQIESGEAYIQEAEEVV